jgi:hypothetical protein
MVEAKQPKQTSFHNKKSQEYFSSSIVKEQTPNLAANLEHVLLIEDKLWTMLEIHRYLEQSQE